MSLLSLSHPMARLHSPPTLSLSRRKRIRPSTKRTTAVSFAPKAEVVHFAAFVADSSNHNICNNNNGNSNFWYTPDELDRIRQRNVLAAQLQRKGVFRESSKHTFFGLEKFLSGRQIQANKRAHWQRMLGDQPAASFSSSKSVGTTTTTNSDHHQYADFAPVQRQHQPRAA